MLTVSPLKEGRVTIAFAARRSPGAIDGKCDATFSSPDEGFRAKDQVGIFSLGAPHVLTLLDTYVNYLCLK